MKVVCCLPRPELLRHGDGPYRVQAHHVAHPLQSPTAAARDQERLILSAVRVPGDGVPVM